MATTSNPTNKSSQFADKLRTSQFANNFGQVSLQTTSDKSDKSVCGQTSHKIRSRGNALKTH